MSSYISDSEDSQCVVDVISEKDPGTQQSHHHGQCRTQGSEEQDCAATESAGEDGHHLRSKINMRERKRMHDLNVAMDSLREVMPYANGPSVRKLSKIATLSLARNYIEALKKSLEEMKQLLDEVYRSSASQPLSGRPLHHVGVYSPGSHLTMTPGALPYSVAYPRTSGRIPGVLGHTLRRPQCPGMGCSCGTYTVAHRSSELSRQASVSDPGSCGNTDLMYYQMNKSPGTHL